MGTSGDKIVLLDGMGSGSGSAANGLLSMIPGMFTSLLGGNKMDPNLVAALMNGRNNQDQFGGANGWEDIASADSCPSEQHRIHGR